MTQGTDSKLHEVAILNSLRNEDIPLTPNGMRSLMSLVLMAAYDRKVEREFFGGLLDDCAMIGIDLADMEKAGAMRQLYVSVKDKDPEGLDTEIEKLLGVFMGKRKRLAEKMYLISQCPTASDNIS